MSGVGPKFGLQIDVDVVEEEYISAIKPYYGLDVRVPENCIFVSYDFFATHRVFLNSSWKILKIMTISSASYNISFFFISSLFGCETIYQKYKFKVKFLNLRPLQCDLESSNKDIKRANSTGVAKKSYKPLNDVELLLFPLGHSASKKFIS